MEIVVPSIAWAQYDLDCGTEEYLHQAVQSIFSTLFIHLGIEDEVSLHKSRYHWFAPWRKILISHGLRKTFSAPE